MAHHGSFIRAFFRNAGSVGAVAPSSEALAELMVDWLDWDEINSVVEFGPGTGVFTEAIEKRARKGTKLIAIERDAELAEITRNRCPEATVRKACVSEAASICEEEGIASADAILCGLPWASFSEELQNTLLDEMFEILPPGGKIRHLRLLAGDWHCRLGCGSDAFCGSIFLRSSRAQRHGRILPAPLLCIDV